MAADTYSNENINRFWLNIMGDNALILLNNLSPTETEDVRQAKAFADKFDALVLRANQNPYGDKTAQLNRDAFQATQDLRRFFLQIAKKLLSEVYYLDIKPSVLNNFVNEAEKYLDFLNAFMQNRPPTFDLIREEIFWLKIFVQQADYLANSVGYYQKENRERALNMAERLNEYWAFSVELRGLARIGREDFPVALEHHQAVVNLLREYYEFLTNLINIQLLGQMPGTLSPLYMDRSRRMVCLFLTRAAQSTNTQLPDCDPYSKRIGTL